MRSGVVARGRRTARGASPHSVLVFRGATMAGVGAIVATTYAVAKSNVFGIGKREHEYVWWGERGIFSPHRAIAILPTGACIASGCFATFLALRFPGRVKSVEFPPGVHEIMAFPLAILVAFRFENSFNRWWSARLEVESVAAEIVSLALSATTNTAIARIPSSNVKGIADDKIAMGVQNHHRFMSLLTSFCIIMSATLNETPSTPDLSSILSHKDNLRFVSAADPVVWCMDCIMECIHTGQALGQFTDELASAMYGTTCSVQRSLRVCHMLLDQPSPAPFVIHLRTFLLLFCLTYPFSIIRRIPSPWTILPVQVMLSYCLLGIEFCSREMEHPFGDDPADIPVKAILQNLETSVRSIQTSKANCNEYGEHIVGESAAA